MRKKYLMIALAGSAILLLGIALGLLVLNSKEEIPPPIFAFASDRNGAGDIYVSDQAGQLHNLTHHPASDWDPVWSQNGRLLAFTSQRSGNSDIWLLDVQQTGEEAQPRNITNHSSWDYSPTWSPSGQSIAFVSERDGDPEIFVQNLESDGALQLTFNHELDRFPIWSPDGKVIAFAAVRAGVEKIYLIRPDGTDEQIATPPHLQGTAPAWSPDSKQLAFIGWDDENRAGIYVAGPTANDLNQLYQGSSWLGSLSWSADGRWLTYTSWESGNHELYVISIEGGYPARLTNDAAWDDFLAINPAAAFSAPAQPSVAQAAPALKLPPDPDFARGVNLADLSMTYLVNDLGFDWAKSYVNWATVEPEPGQFRWVDPDNIIKAMGDQQVQILMRVHGTPAWARSSSSSYTHPPDDVAKFADFMTALATRYKGKVAAYEIGNEPNLSYEWGNLTPDPAGYTEILKAAYLAVKKVDPEALIISGGLATTGDGSPTAYGDLKFLQGMYDAGAKGYFDALGSHPYTFGRPPNEVDPWGLSLSRVAEQYEVMKANEDGDRPIWITEMGWVLQTDWNLGEHQMLTVTEAQQAQYLSEAYASIENKWPFVKAIFLFNLDFSTVFWYPAPEPMRWYAILNPDRTPRPAYTLLRQQMRSQ